MRYDRARQSLDRHATYIVAALCRRRRPLTIHWRAGYVGVCHGFAIGNIERLRWRSRLLQLALLVARLRRREYAVHPPPPPPKALVRLSGGSDLCVVNAHVTRPGSGDFVRPCG